MIQGINPLHITDVHWKKGYRVGPHPLLVKLVKQRGWLNYVRWQFCQNDRFFDDGFYPAEVVIAGSSRILKRIECQSNADARRLRNEIYHEMVHFFGNLEVLEKLRKNI